MAFIGNTPAESFTATSKQSFSGDDNTTQFTLTNTGTTNGVAVFVENVRQEPGTAYTVSGTTLTFTAAPVTGTNNIYVVNGGLRSTVGLPAGTSINATTGTFTGDVKLETSSGGIYTITGTDTSSNRTLTLPDVAGTVVTSDPTSFPAGTVIKVGSVTKTDRYTESVASGGISSDITGLTLSFTPLVSTSKLLITCDIGGSTSGGTNPGRKIPVILYADGSPASGAIADDDTGQTGEVQASGTIVDNDFFGFGAGRGGFTAFIDAGSTSARTYSIRLVNGDASTATLQVNRPRSEPNSNRNENVITTLTVMEIAQ